jgi:hypothetical protein
VPADDWSAGVDAREPRMTRKAPRKCPAPERPSQKRKSTDPLGTRGPLIISDEESGRKRRRVVASLPDDKEDAGGPVEGTRGAPHADAAKGAHSSQSSDASKGAHMAPSSDTPKGSNTAPSSDTSPDGHTEHGLGRLNSPRESPSLVLKIE